MNAPRPTIIGLTGNIATGKSTVMRWAAARGALVIDADKVVHRLLAADPAVQAAVREAFGDGVCTAEGAIDRAALGRVVFADAEALRRLELIVHPAVGSAVQRQIAESDATIIVIEAIKLLEGSLRALCDAIWVTTCTPEQQIERLQRYRQMSRADAERRVAAQSPQAAKIAQADVVIDTNGTLEETAAQFERAWDAMEWTIDRW